MRKNKEVWGLRFELAGLLVVLAATFWQVIFTDWWDQTLREWQAYIQEEVNVAILLSLKDLASLETTEDPEGRSKISLAVYDRTSKAAIEAISKREQRGKEIRQGQANLFAKIRNLLLVLGAGLLVIGKWIALSGVRARTSSPSSTSVP